MLLHILEKNDQSVEPKFSGYRCSSYGAREDFGIFIKKKIDFLCEKPISKTNKKIKLFKSLSKKNNNKKIIDLNFLTIPAIIKFKEIINKMNLTNDDLIKINWFFKPKSQSDKQSWKNNIKKIGGELNNFLFHLLSVIFYFLETLKFLICKIKIVFTFF